MGKSHLGVSGVCPSGSEKVRMFRLQCQGTADVSPQDPSDDTEMCILLGYQSILYRWVVLTNT